MSTSTSTSTPSPPSNPPPFISTHKAKHPWPPSLSTLHPSHQFRLEKTYKRRAALRFTNRPTFFRVTKLLQWGLCSGVVVWGVLYADWDREFVGARGGGGQGPPAPTEDGTGRAPEKMKKREPFAETRRAWRALLDGMWSTSAEVMPRGARKQQQQQDGTGIETTRGNRGNEG